MEEENITATNEIPNEKSPPIDGTVSNSSDASVNNVTGDEDRVDVKKAKFLVPKTNEGDNSEIVDSEYYRCFASKIKGLSHYKSATNCQDMFLIEPFMFNGKENIIAAVADGHGGESHYFSEFGAAIAVRCIIDQIKYICGKAKDVYEIYSAVKDFFPRALYKSWGDAILDDYDKKRKNETENEIDQVAILKKYGTTAMVCFTVGKTLIFGKLDGNIVVLVNDSLTEPLPDGDDLMGSEAYSLCKRRNALTKWEFSSVSEAGFLTISTDGFRNAFGEDDDPGLFYDAVKYIYGYMGENGIESTLSALPEILSKCSNEASGDDVTLCCFVRKADSELTESADPNGYQTEPTA
jgi:serine/threonine protein phosphatase PrpC